MLLTTIECSNCGAYHDSTLEECPNCHKSNELRTLKDFPKNVFFLHPVAQLCMFAIGFTYIGMIIAVTIFYDITDSDFYAQLFAFILAVIGMLSIVLFTRRKMFLDTFKGLDKYLYGILVGIVVGALALVIVNLIPLWYHGEGNNNQSTVESLVNLHPIIGFFVLCFLGPISEELAYRVGLYSFLRRFNKYLALILTTIVFALVHLDFNSENLIGELWSLPAYLLAAFALTFIYEKKGLPASLTAHVLYNLVSFLMVIFNGQQA